MKIAIVAGVLAAALLPQHNAVPSVPKTNESIQIGSTTESLTAVSTLVVARDLSLTLEPGVRATRSNNAISLSTHDGSKIDVTLGDRQLALLSPVTAKFSNGGWDFGTGTIYPDAKVVARKAPQDDTDSNLKSMQESAKKLKNKSNQNNQQANNGGKKKGNLRFLYGSSNPMGTSEAFSSTAIQQLTHTSAIGF